MSDASKDTDRRFLEADRGYFRDDPTETMTEAQLDRIMGHFSASSNGKDPKLRTSVQMQFQQFFVAARNERFRARNGSLEKVSKPSTIIESEMQELHKACSTIYDRLASLDQASKDWLDQYLDEQGATNKSEKTVGLHDLEARIYWPLEVLMYASRSAEGLSSRGANNIALGMMIEKMAGCWEICHGKPPITDKGRGRQDDPFLALCQDMAAIAHAKLGEFGGGIGTLNLSGLVGSVLENRRRELKK